jgi:peptidoglycan hydrolase-like protein with peptidoglycan-binding domain
MILKRTEEERIKRPFYRVLAMLPVVVVTSVLISLLSVQNAFPTTAIALSWIAPSTNTDGTPLNNIAGYKIYYGKSSGTYTNSIDVGYVNSSTISNLPDGIYYLAATVYDTLGRESAYSNEVIRSSITLASKIAVFYNGGWYMDPNGNGIWDGTANDKLYPTFGNGLSNAIPVTGDWDGTGVIRIGVFSNGSWYFDMNGNGVWDGGVVDKVIPNFGRGLPNAIPVTGDWNGSGTTKIGVFSNGSWYLDMKGDGVWDGGVVDKVIPNFGQGLPNAIPVTGDWNDSGTTKIGVFSNGSWYLDMKGDGVWDGGVVDVNIPNFGQGLNGSIPIVLKKK